MNLVELWMLLKNEYEEHHYNIHRLVQIKRKFSHVTYDAGEIAIKVGIWSASSGRKTTKNQYEALIIEYHTNITDALEEAGNSPAATHVRNMQRR